MLVLLFYPNIFQHVKSDRDPINPLDTADIYRIEYTDENSKKGYYIRVTKRKINERLKEYQCDLKNAKSNTAIARLALKQNIKIDFKNAKKISNYNNRTHGHCHKTIENKNNSITCNDAEHFFLHQESRHIISKKSMHRGREGE